VKVKLHGRPLEVLSLLLERPGDVVTREELRQRLWADNTIVDFDHGLNNAVNKLREALADSAENPRFVETLPRKGYRFIAQVEWVNGTPQAPATHLTEPRSGFPSTRVIVLAAFALALAVVAYQIWQRPARPAAASDQKTMLAVLPFENLSGDPEQEYFSDGMTEEMIAQLGRLQPARLGVIARTSAMHYKGTDKRVDEIGQELSVDYILEGSVRREADRVRITAQLIQVSDQAHLWGESYERELAGVFVVQSDVAGHIARSLKIELLPARQANLASAGEVNPAAYEAYLKGRHFSRQGWRGSRDYYEEAISIDPNYAPAYAGLANRLLFRPPAVENMPRARQAALKALELDPALPDAHSALGLVHLMFEWNWQAAERAFQHALALDPSDPETHLRYSNYLAAMGRLDEAIAAARRAQQFDPLSPLIGQVIGRLYYFLGQDDRAIEEYKKTLELHPDFHWGHFFLSIAYEQKGQYDLWFSHLKKSWLSWGADPALWDKWEKIYQEKGYKAAVREMVAYSKSIVESRGFMSHSALALDSIKLGEKEEALYWLEKAYEDHTRDLIYLNVEPQYDPIRDHPRFQEIVRRIGLPAPAEARTAD
jgi:TolB-like protein/lipoprotein NlpI